MFKTCKAVPVLLTMLILCVGGEALGAGFKGGGGRGGGGRGGGARAARPASRPAARPASRPSAPKMGGGRPATRPNVKRPTASRPAVSRPTSNRRPPMSRPQLNRPTGGMKPSRPTQRPQARPQTRPQTRPQNRPNITRPGGNRPTTRPSFPNMGGGTGSRPGTSRPGRPGGNLANRPGTARPGTTRPSRPGGGARPSPGDLGDFLGMDKPLRPAQRPGRPGGGGDRPGIGNRPGGGGDRPGIGGDRPGRPGGGADRPGIGNRPGRPGGGGDRPNRPDWIGGGGGEYRPNRPGKPGWGNGGIHNRPGWANRPGAGGIYDRWPRPGRPGYGMGNWLDRHPGRYDRWNNWGNNVRLHYNDFDFYHNCFTPSWWGSHYHGIGGWHYGYCFDRYPSSYWWTVPTFTSLTDWFTWSAPATVWQEPIYYDYGQGGNVYYENNMVYVDGQEVGTPQDFAASAAELATVEPPATEAEAENTDWMPLGTFAVSSSQQEANPTRVVQLAVNKTGIVSGTLYNKSTDQAQTVLGRIDKETQRVALRIGESDDIVVETGLYNLTQDDAPVMVHFGPDRVENWLLVRLENPEVEEGNP